MNMPLVIKKPMLVLFTLMVLLSLVAPVMAREDKAAQGG
jgi:hypothetical protein